MKEEAKERGEEGRAFKLQVSQGDLKMTRCCFSSNFKIGLKTIVLLPPNDTVKWGMVVCCT